MEMYNCYYTFIGMWWFIGTRNIVVEDCDQCDSLEMS